ncbi:Os01g0693600 [Oryza sativa Japonica Group]|uniref:Os01g0693600 protein n=1 Tax=Oryza sativa subsp. japonica TaxID=39947 RepID=A0A0P0V6X8_ORYSJ|nr:Os01g0693600 [Oryza sativa Japonica Group]
MDPNGFDFFSQDPISSAAGNIWSSQPSASGPSHGSVPRAGVDTLDLNTQAASGQEFPHLHEYGAFLQGGGEEGAGRGRGSGLPPIRAPRSLGVRAGRGGAGPSRAAPRARQLNFGAVGGRAGHGGNGGSSSGIGGGGPGRGSSSSGATGRRRQRAMATNRGRDRGRGGRGWRVPRSVGTQEAPIGDYVDLDEEGAWDDEVEELGSFGGPPVSIADRANWTDRNNSILLALCIEQVRAGHYNGSQMNSDGYNAIAEGYHAKTGLMHSRLQLKNQIGILKSTYSFWRYLQTHTGLGRKPDGTVDADSDFWSSHIEGKPYLKKVLKGLPANLDQLEEMFSGSTVDGSTAFAAGDDFGEAQEGAEDEWAEETEEFLQTPQSTSSQKSKRSLDSTTSTCSTPVKKSKSPMVKYVKDISMSFKEAMQINSQELRKRTIEKQAASVRNCMKMAFECGIEQTTENIFAMSKMFENPYQREFFVGLPNHELRFNYFSKWSRDNNLV